MHSCLVKASLYSIGGFRKALSDRCVNNMERDKKYLTSSKWLSALSFVVVISSAILIIFIQALPYSIEDE